MTPATVNGKRCKQTPGIRVRYEGWPPKYDRFQSRAQLRLNGLSDEAFQELRNDLADLEARASAGDTDARRQVQAEHELPLPIGFNDALMPTLLPDDAGGSKGCYWTTGSADRDTKWTCHCGAVYSMEFWMLKHLFNKHGDKSWYEAAVDHVKRGPPELPTATNADGDSLVTTGGLRRHFVLTQQQKLLAAHRILSRSTQGFDAEAQTLMIRWFTPIFAALSRGQYLEASLHEIDNYTWRDSQHIKALKAYQRFAVRIKRAIEMDACLEEVNAVVSEKGGKTATSYVDQGTFSTDELLGSRLLDTIRTNHVPRKSAVAARDASTLAMMLLYARSAPHGANATAPFTDTTLHELLHCSPLHALLFNLVGATVAGVSGSSNTDPSLVINVFVRDADAKVVLKVEQWAGGAYITSDVDGDCIDLSVARAAAAEALSELSVRTAKSNADRLAAEKDTAVVAALVGTKLQATQTTTASAAAAASTAANDTHAPGVTAPTHIVLTVATDYNDTVRNSLLRKFRSNHDDAMDADESEDTSGAVGSLHQAVISRVEQEAARLQTGEVPAKPAKKAKFRPTSTLVALREKGEALLRESQILSKHAADLTRGQAEESQLAVILASSNDQGTYSGSIDSNVVSTCAFKADGISELSSLMDEFEQTRALMDAASLNNWAGYSAEEKVKILDAFDALESKIDSALLGTSAVQQELDALAKAAT